MMRSGGIPVPIPNTTVKPGTAESTMLETAWEVRWLPDFFKHAYGKYVQRGLIAQLVQKSYEPYRS